MLMCYHNITINSLCKSIRRFLPHGRLQSVCLPVCLFVCPSVTTLASAILNRSSQNFTRSFGTRIVRTSSLGVKKIGQQLRVYAHAQKISNAKNRAKIWQSSKNTHKIAFLAKISRIHRFWGMSDQMAWSDLKPEVVYMPFLCMRSTNMPQGALKIDVLATISQLYRFLCIRDWMAGSECDTRSTYFDHFCTCAVKICALKSPKIAF